MVQTKTSHLGKVSYAIILLGWRYEVCGYFMRGNHTFVEISNFFVHNANEIF